MTFDRYLKFVIAAVQWTIKHKDNSMAVFSLGGMQVGNTCNNSIQWYVYIFYQRVAPELLPSSLSPPRLNLSIWKIRNKERWDEDQLLKCLRSEHGKSYVDLNDENSQLSPSLWTHCSKQWESSWEADVIVFFTPSIHKDGFYLLLKLLYSEPMAVWHF